MASFSASSTGVKSDEATPRRVNSMTATASVIRRGMHVRRFSELERSCSLRGEVGRNHASRGNAG